MQISGHRRSPSFKYMLRSSQPTWLVSPQENLCYTREKTSKNFIFRIKSFSSNKQIKKTWRSALTILRSSFQSSAFSRFFETSDTQQQGRLKVTKKDHPGRINFRLSVRAGCCQVTFTSARPPPRPHSRAVLFK